MHDELARRLAALPTGTLATTLRQKGLSRVWMKGPRPVAPGQPRIAGPAVTVRFVPAREDITTSAALSSPQSFRAFIDGEHPGAVLVASTGGVREAGVIGDILAVRLARNGVVGLVTDGVVRDIAAVAQSGLAVWAQGASSPPSVAGLHYCESGSVVACGGVTVLPGDYIVADEDGAIVIPAALAPAIATEAEGKERFEAWVLSKVRSGEPLLGLYPPSPETKARFEREAASRKD
jgi:regulator of RNase E activity RraA